VCPLPSASTRCVLSHQQARCVFSHQQAPCVLSHQQARCVHSQMPGLLPLQFDQQTLRAHSRASAPITALDTRAVGLLACARGHLCAYAHQCACSMLQVPAMCRGCTLTRTVPSFAPVMTASPRLENTMKWMSFVWLSCMARRNDAHAERMSTQAERNNAHAERMPGGTMHMQSGCQHERNDAHAERMPGGMMYMQSGCQHKQSGMMHMQSGCWAE